MSDVTLLFAAEYIRQRMVPLRMKFGEMIMKSNRG